MSQHIKTFLKTFIFFILDTSLLVMCKISNRKIALLRCDRIGHLAINTEIFFRQRQLGIISKEQPILFFASNPANRQLLEMIKRKLPVFESNFLYMLLKTFEFKLETKSYYFILKMDLTEHKEVSQGHPTLSFTEAELQKGQEQLLKMGLKKDSWFICIHSREPEYLEKRYGDKEKFSYHNYRDCKIENYLSAAKYITDLGGYVIRMGELVDKPLLVNNPQIIDYATKYRSDFMDIFLAAKCKFFLGNTSGLFLVSTMFDTPTAAANFIPSPHTPWNHKDLFIPKPIKDKAKQRLLKFNEARELGMFDLFSGKYDLEKYDIIENSANEILGLCKEMNERIDSSIYNLSENQLKYQEDVMGKTKKYAKSRKFSAPIAKCFIDEEYAELLD